jgi:hypothetical protein
MSGSKKEKHYANSRARRHSDIIITHGKKSKKEKDADTESVSSTTNSSSDTVVVSPPPEKKCPLRFLLPGMIEPESDEKKSRGCPLRRVQLWHVIPLCLLAIINLLLVVIALIGLAGYRITMGVQGVLISIIKTDLECNPYAESLADTDDGTLVDRR